MCAQVWINTLNPDHRYIILENYSVQINNDGKFYYTALVDLRWGQELTKLPTEIVKSNWFVKAGLIDMRAMDHVLEAILNHKDRYITIPRGCNTFLGKEVWARHDAALKWYDNCIYENVIGFNALNGDENRIEIIRRLRQKFKQLEIFGFDVEKEFPGSFHLLQSLIELEVNHRMINKCARKIQDVWRQCVSDPGHGICQRRLMREFTDGIGSAFNHSVVVK